MMRTLITAAFCVASSLSYGQFCDSPANKANLSPAEFGPWAVGAKTIQIKNLTAEVWYPADPSSVLDQDTKVYDIREHLPSREGKKIPDSENPLQYCECYDNAPVAESEQKFPIVLFIHGTASFRTQALNQMTHWASRGFVVVSLDHPRIRLKDILGPGGAFGSILANQARDGRTALEALRQASGELSFLKGKIDSTKIALAGHSAGGGAVRQLANERGVQVLMPMTAGSVSSDGFKGSALYFGADRDGVVGYESQMDGFKNHKGEKVFVGLKNAGHLAYSEICSIGKENGGILAIAQKYGVNVPSIVARLGRDGCGEDYLSPEKGWEIINYASTMLMEDKLYCDKPQTSLTELNDEFPGMVDLK